MNASVATVTLVAALAKLRPGLRIELLTLRRAQFAYDASNYRIAPTAIAHPRDVDDVAAILGEHIGLGSPSRPEDREPQWRATQSGQV